MYSLVSLALFSFGSASTSAGDQPALQCPHTRKNLEQIASVKIHPQAARWHRLREETFPQDCGLRKPRGPINASSRNRTHSLCDCILLRLNPCRVPLSIYSDKRNQHKLTNVTSLLLEWKYVNLLTSFLRRSLQSHMKYKMSSEARRAKQDYKHCKEILLLWKGYERNNTTWNSQSTSRFQLRHQSVIFHSQSGSTTVSPHLSGFPQHEPQILLFESAAPQSEVTKSILSIQVLYSQLLSRFINLSLLLHERSPRNGCSADRC